MMRTISVRNAYKVIGSEPSPYTNKVYAYMRYKNIPFANVPGWFPIKKTLEYTACTEIIMLMQIREPSMAVRGRSRAPNERPGFKY